jgi:hypothetical protein
MANQETIVQNEIRLAISSPSVRMFRNNVGAFKNEAGRLVEYGLGKGSSDLVGFVVREITPEMVGKSIAVFAAIEVKTNSGRVSNTQKAFIDMVRNKGGLAGVARSIDDAKAMLEGDL